MRRRNSAFTLIEALVAAAIAAIGVAATVSAIGALQYRQGKVNQQELMLRLASDKFHEIESLQDFTTPAGDFTDRSDSNHLWQMQLTPATVPTSASSGTTTSASTNAAMTANQGQLQVLTVTVHPSSSNAPADSESVSGLVWESQQAQNGATSNPGQ